MCTRGAVARGSRVPPRICDDLVVACANHPAVAEAHRCTHCDALWCHACVRSVTVAGRVVCPACGHAVARAAPMLTAEHSVRDAVRRVASVEGITTAGGFAVAYMLARWVPVFAIFYLSALVAYYFTIIHHVGDGHGGLPGPSDAAEDWLEVGGFALRGVLCVLLGVLPVAGWWLATRELPSAATTAALAVAAQLYMPAAVLAVTLSGNGLAVAWPPAWIAIIARAPRAYARFVGLWIGSLAVGALVCIATLELLGDAMFLGAWLAATVWALYWFAQAGLVGNFMRANAQAFGWE